MPDVRCISASGHPGTLLDGASRPWSRGDVRPLSSLVASALVERHPSRFAVVDRVIRGSSPAPTLPAGVLDTHHRALVASIKRGDHDGYLAPMRASESSGSARPSILEAIDARSREVAVGGV